MTAPPQTPFQQSILEPEPGPVGLGLHRVERLISGHVAGRYRTRLWFIDCAHAARQDPGPVGLGPQNDRRASLQ